MSFSGRVSSKFGISSMLRCAKKVIKNNAIINSTFGILSYAFKASDSSTSSIQKVVWPARVNHIREKARSPKLHNREFSQKICSAKYQQKIQAYLEHDYWIAVANALARDASPEARRQKQFHHENTPLTPPETPCSPATPQQPPQEQQHSGPQTQTPPQTPPATPQSEDIIGRPSIYRAAGLRGGDSKFACACREVIVYLEQKSLPPSLGGSDWVLKQEIDTDGTIQNVWHCTRTPSKEPTFQGSFCKQCQLKYDELTATKGQSWPPVKDVPMTEAPKGKQQPQPQHPLPSFSSNADWFKSLSVPSTPASGNPTPLSPRVLNTRNDRVLAKWSSTNKVSVCQYKLSKHSNGLNRGKYLKRLLAQHTIAQDRTPAGLTLGSQWISRRVRANALRTKCGTCNETIITKKHGCDEYSRVAHCACSQKRKSAETKFANTRFPCPFQFEISGLRQDINDCLPPSLNPNLTDPVLVINDSDMSEDSSDDDEDVEMDNKPANVSGTAYNSEMELDESTIYTEPPPTSEPLQSVLQTSQQSLSASTFGPRDNATAHTQQSKQDSSIENIPVAKNSQPAAPPAPSASTKRSTGIRASHAAKAASANTTGMSQPVKPQFIPKHTTYEDANMATDNDRPQAPAPKRQNVQASSRAVPRPAIANAPSTFTMVQQQTQHQPQPQPQAPGPISGPATANGVSAFNISSTPSSPRPTPARKDDSFSKSFVDLGDDEENCVPPPGSRKVLSAKGKTGARITSFKETARTPTKQSGPINDLVYLVPAAREHVGNVASDHESAFKYYLKEIDNKPITRMPSSDKTFSDIAAYAAAGVGAKLQFPSVEKKKCASREESEGFIQAMSDLSKDMPQIWECLLGLLLQSGYNPNEMLKFHALCQQNRKEGAALHRYQIFDDEWRVNYHHADSHFFDKSNNGPGFRETQDYYSIDSLSPEDQQRVREYMSCISPEVRPHFNDIVYDWAMQNKHEMKRIAHKAGWSLIHEQNKWLSMYEWVRDIAPEAVRIVLLPYMQWRFPRAARFADELNGKR